MSPRSFRRTGLVVSVIAVAGLGSTLPAVAADTSDSEAAVWTPKEASFTYMGFTTRYSCEGLVGKVKSVLLVLGARREGLTVYGTGCEVSAGRPAPFPGVKVRMSVLVPASEATRSAQAVTAHWKPVQVQLDADPLKEAGECELVEQIQQKLLPLFSTRGVEFKPNCVPHQLHPGGTRLQAQVLVADAGPKEAAAAQSR
jgi:hypothetical protein